MSDENQVERDAFRHLAAGVMAHDLVLRVLFGNWLREFPPEARYELVEAMRDAIRRTETLAGTAPNDLQAELLADVAVLAQEKLDGIIRLVLGDDPSLRTG